VLLPEPAVYDLPTVADAPPGGVVRPVLFAVLDVVLLGVTVEVALAPVLPLVAVPAEPPVVAVELLLVIAFAPVDVLLPVAFELVPVVPPEFVLFVAFCVLEAMAPPGMIVTDPLLTGVPAVLLVAFVPAELDVLLGALAVTLPPVVALDVAFVLGITPMAALLPVLALDVALVLGVMLLVVLPVVPAVALSAVPLPVMAKLAVAAWPNESKASTSVLWPPT
jgi:hypothetical protein